MDSEKLRKIFRKFVSNDEFESAKPFGNGHINDTYLVNTKKSLNKYILQRKNHLVFKDIDGMMSNIAQVTNCIKSALKESGETDVKRKTIIQFPSIDGKFYFRDEGGNYWTLVNYISNSKSFEKIEKTEQAYDTGKAFGQFQKLVSKIDPKSLIETIPNFHNIDFRLKNFEKAVLTNSAGRLREVPIWVDELKGYAEEMRTLQKMYDAGKLPLRITHNDTKINNILFDKDSEEVLCVIDLDTVMPGLIHYDFGDAMRTGGSTVIEDERDLEKIDFNMAVFEQFTDGFLSELRTILTETEKKYLAHSVKFMAYIMALRFMTDYLSGDVYYKISYPEHNLIRSKNQLVLIRKINEKIREMESILKKYS